MIEQENKLILVMGDFSINLMNYENHTPTNDFINMMSAYYFQPSVLPPTRFTDSTSTLIDNIFVNNATGSNMQSGNIFFQISECFPQFCMINNCTFDYKTPS